MEIIQSGWQPVCEVLCSVCGERESVVFHRNKDYHTDEDKIVFTFEFKDKGNTFRSRLRQTFYTLKNFQQFKDGKDQTYNEICMSTDQVSELYTKLLSECQTGDIFSSGDIDYINSFNHPVPIKFNELPESCSIQDIVLFKSQENLVFSIETTTAHDKATNADKTVVFDLGFSFAIDSKMTKKQLRKRIYGYLRGHTPFLGNAYSGFLYKEETVQLLANMRYILDNLDGDKLKVQL